MSTPNPTDRPVGEPCGATNRQGEPCGNTAGKGTDHVGFGNCKNHGGASPNGAKHAAKEEAAWRARVVGEIDPSIDTVVELRDDAGQSGNVRLQSAKDLLDRAGVRIVDEESEQSVTIHFSMDDIA